MSFWFPSGDEVTCSWAGAGIYDPALGDAVSASWEGDSEHSALLGDAVTGTFEGAAAPNPPDGDRVTGGWFIEIAWAMPSAPWVITVSPGDQPPYPEARFPTQAAVAVTIDMGYGADPSYRKRAYIQDGAGWPLSIGYAPAAYPSFDHLADGDPISVRIMDGWAYQRYQRSPEFLIPGYACDGTNITIPIASLGDNLLVAEADAVNGSWLEIFQALCIFNDAWLVGLDPEKRPLTVGSKQFVDYNAKHRTLGPGVKRTFYERFYINFASSAIKEE